MKYDYFYGREAEQFSFVRIPKVLLSKKYSELSTDAKMLYGVFLDRMSLSMKNGWMDEKHRVYIIYEIKEVMKNFEIAKNTAIKLLKELEKCVAMQWVDIQDILEIQEKLKEHKQ